MKEILVTKRADDYHACLKEDPTIWGCGKTGNQAIGDLVSGHCITFDVGIGINEDHRYINDFVNTHAAYTQDPLVDFPSFAYRVVWKGKEYMADSKEDLVREIVRDNP
jgi:hypothetical protein